MSDSGVQIPSRYWIWHLVLTVTLPVVAVVYVLWAYGEPGGLRSVALISTGPFLLLSAVAALAALRGYYVEARQLRAAGSEWVPSPHKWAAFHILAGPYIAGPIYLHRRKKHVGIPWSSLPVARRARST